MNLKYRHITGIGLLLYGLLGLVSCTSESLELPREEEDDYNIFLTFQAAVAGVSTRAGEAQVADDRVKTLRIVIVSREKVDGATWKVEHNEQVSLVTPLPHEYTFKVAPNSLKRIYLIANETELANTKGTLDFSDEMFIPAEVTGNATVDDYVFNVSASGYSYTPSALPMTGLYEFEVPTLEEIKNGEFKWPDPLYLVRAATKFTFEFTNQSTQRDITVTGIDIQQVITDQMYLMPHVNKQEYNGQSKYWVVEETGTGDNVTYTKKPVADWLDWMGQEAEKSNRGEDNEWLTDYEVPTTEKTTAKLHTELQMSAATGTEPYPSVKAPNAIYLPESKTEKTSDDEYHLQEYSITVHTEEGGERKEYTATLPHLASLFRNTHVEVGAIFTDQDHTINWVVDVIPFTSVELKPDYGLEREEFTSYVVGKDKDGRECWYDGNYYAPATAVPLYLGPKDNPGKFVTINGKKYLLVYTDYERTVGMLDHIFDVATQKRYFLSPAGRTGYENVSWIYYLNDLKHPVWLDEDYMEWNVVWNAEKKKEEWVYTVGKWYRTLNEWDRVDWNRAVWDKEVQDPRIYPKFWFDVLGNRYSWSEGDTKEKRAVIIGEWVQYLE